MNTNTQSASDASSVWRWIIGGVIILIAVGAMTWVFFQLVGDQTVEPLAAFAAFSGPVVAIVSAFFGIQACTSAAKAAASNTNTAITGLTQANDQMAAFLAR